MSYATELARAHKARMARIWPDRQSIDMRVPMLAANIADLEKRRDELIAEIEALKAAKEALTGEQRLVELRERICADHEISIAMLVSPMRSAKLVIARKQFAQEARAMGASLPRIAYHLGGRNHATIFFYLHGKRRKPEAVKDADQMVG